MKNLLYLLLCSALILSCSKDDNGIESSDRDQIESSEKWGNPNGECPKPYHIWHQKGNGDYVEICIDCCSYWSTFWNEECEGEPGDEGHSGHAGDYFGEYSDVDGDGYAPNPCGFGLPGDCDDTDPAVNPGAEEVCGDGIDNNCDGVVDEDCSCDPDGSSLLDLIATFSDPAHCVAPVWTNCSDPSLGSYICMNTTNEILCEEGWIWITDCYTGSPTVSVVHHQNSSLNQTISITYDEALCFQEEMENIGLAHCYNNKAAKEEGNDYIPSASF